MDLRVIIGQGTATEVYRSTLAADDKYHTIVLGPRGLWAALPREHRMGQPPALLHLPGQPVPAHSKPSGKTSDGLKKFLDVNTYQQGLINLSKANDLRLGRSAVLSPRSPDIQMDQIKATAVLPGFRKGQLLVETSDRNICLLADQVIIANGIGPQLKPQPPGGINGKPDPTVGFQQIVEGVEFMNNPGPCGKCIAVYGGSATAAWVADGVVKRLKGTGKMRWFTRPGGSEFKGCTLPGDRNYEILEMTKDLRLLAELKQIDYLPATKLGNRILRRPMLKLTLQPRGGQEQICLVDQLVYSLGGDPTAEGSIQQLVAPDVRRRLQPLKDKNRVISDGSGVLALATPEGDLMIIGSATYNYSSFTFKKQAAPMHTLPLGSQVPDGIAMVVASVQALNNSMPIKQDAKGNVTESNINFNLADRNQLAVYIAAIYPDIPPAAAGEIVTRVINVRSSKQRNEPWGITEAKFQEIIQQYT